MSTSVASGSEKQKSAGSFSGLTLSKVDVRLPAGVQVFQALRQAILDMRLPPGCPVSESEIAAKMGASRTPVREALLRLREEGLIQTLASRGSFVMTMSRELILDAQFLREAIELASVSRVTRTGLSDDDRKHLENNLIAQAAAVARADYPEFHVLDDQFHLLIARATGLRRVEVVLDREKAQLDRLRSLALRVDGQLQTLLNEHDVIFQAIIAADVEAATDHMRSHCRTVLNVLESLSTRHQEYFDQ